MYQYLAIILLTVFISFCFFKKNIWQYRYLILIIIASASFVSTVATNLISRGSLDTYTKVVSESKIESFYLKEETLNDALISKHPSKRFAFHAGNVKSKLSSYHFFYYGDGGTLRVGYSIKGVGNYQDVDDVYIVPSKTIRAIRKVRKDYKIRDSKWTTDYSIPRIGTIKVLYIPVEEYEAIPDSLIRELPFKI